MAGLLNFKNATQPTNEENKLIYEESINHLNLSCKNAYDYIINDPLNQLKSVRHLFSGSSTSSAVRPSFDVIHQPINDEFIDSVILTYDTGTLTHSDSNARQSKDDWLFWVIDSIDVCLNDKILLKISRRSVDGLSKFMNTQSYGIYVKNISVTVTNTKKRISVKLPLKPNMFDNLPMYIRAGAKLSFKITFNTFAPAYFDGVVPTTISADCSHELELLRSVPIKPFQPNTPVIDKTYIVTSNEFSFLNDELEGKDTTLSAIPLSHGNVVAVVLMCSRVKENVKKYPILLNNFKIKISGGNGFNIAQYNGTRREMLVNGEYLSFDNETPGTIPIYFTEIDEFVKTRNLNKTTFSRELERLLINIKINNGGLNVVYDNKPTMHTIYVVQIIETYIIQ